MHRDPRLALGNGGKGAGRAILDAIAEWPRRGDFRGSIRGLRTAGIGAKPGVRDTPLSGEVGSNAADGDLVIEPRRMLRPVKPPSPARQFGPNNGRPNWKRDTGASERGRLVTLYP